MVFHADADDRRSAAVNRLARWIRRDRWHPLNRPRPVEWLIGRRYVAAERAVERAAVRDLLAGRQHAVFRPTRLHGDDHARTYHDAVAHYRAAFDRLAGYSGDAAGRPAPPAGVPPARQARQVRRHDRRWD